MSIEFKNISDINGKPAGGYAKGPGVEIDWESAEVIDVVLAVVSRLTFLQKANQGKFSSRESSFALKDMESAWKWLAKSKGLL